MPPLWNDDQAGDSSNEECISQEVRLHPEQLAMSLMNAPNVGVGICDRDFRFCAVNEALAVINGLPADNHFGHSIHDILGEVANKIDPLFRHVVATGSPVLNVHLTGKLPMRPDAGHWIENYFPLKDANGIVTRLCSVVIEVTEQKKLEESLRLLNALNTEGRDQLKILSEFHGGLVAKSDFGELVAAITTYVNRLIPHDYAMLTLEDETARAFDMDAKESTGVRMVNAFGTAPSFLHGPHSVDLSGPNQKSQSKSITWDQMLGPGIESVFNMRLVIDGSVLGTLHLASRQPRAFEELRRELVEHVSMHAALAVEYARISKENERLKRRFAEQTIDVKEGQDRGEGFPEIIGDSVVLKNVLDQARMVARTEAAVLILGDAGTGKELMADAIHRLSRRSQKNFVKIKFTSIPERLLESELFGHEKGAFTGAVTRKIGRLELADGGTLLLDEIGDLPKDLQAKLLRVLQDGEFERLGSARTIRVSARIIATTQRDLSEQVAAGSFLKDLYSRLNIFVIRMLPLGERREDIPQLVRHFVRKFSKIMNKQVETIPDELMEALQRRNWPGNIQELEHFIERSMILTSGAVLHDSLTELQEPKAAPEPPRTLEVVEREYILKVLRETGGKVAGTNGAAAKLGLKRTTLQSRMAKLKIRRTQFYGGESHPDRDEAS